MYVDEQGEQAFKWVELERVFICDKSCTESKSELNKFQFKFKCTFQTIDYTLNLYRCLIVKNKKYLTSEIEFNMLRKLMSILTQAEIPVNDSTALHEMHDDDLSDKPLFECDNKAGDPDDTVTKKFLTNRIYLKKQFIGILYRALHLLIYKQPNTKRIEFASLNLSDSKPVDSINWSTACKAYVYWTGFQ